MTAEDDHMELVRGGGNVFRDLGMPDAEGRQLKAILAAQVVKVLDGDGITTRKAGS